MIIIDYNLIKKLREIRIPGTRIFTKEPLPIHKGFKFLIITYFFHSSHPNTKVEKKKKHEKT